jgi:3-phenylpropionate/cinnamic acid dioxygenase small subunit
MTQRVELAIVMDRLAVDEVITEYAVAVDDGDWEAYRKLFAPDGRNRSPDGSRRACDCFRCGSI